MTIMISAAITAINPDADFSVKGNIYEGVRWLNGTTLIPKSEIQAKLAELQAAYDAQAYAREREAEYPSWADQLDHIFHNGVASWKTNVVQPVKDKYPKG
jgi:hypothetical protein